MIDILVNDINTALENEAYLSALSLVLTLPDVCGKAKYPNKKVGERYISWYDEYVGQYETYIGKTTPYLSGEVVYSLRNSFLHQATPDIDKDKISESQNKIDEFVLVIEPKKEIEIYADTTCVNADNKIYNVNIQRLCLIITKCALNYYNDNKNLFDFIQYEIRYQK